MRVIEFEGVPNARDLGGVPVEGDRMVKPGLLYRGSALNTATQADCARLADLGVSCIIDVRCGWEREAKPDAETPGIPNLHIPFYDLEIVGIDYTEPAAGTKTVGRDIACEPANLYRSLSNPLTAAQMRSCVNEAFSRATEGRAVYLHCNGGKDRVGILSLLLLTVLGADRDAIREDYLLTNVSRDARYDEMFERFLRLSDGDEERAHELVLSHRALPEYLDTFYAGIDERYGDMESFVRDQLGVDDQARAFYRERCTVPR